MVGTSYCEYLSFFDLLVLETDSLFFVVLSSTIKAETQGMSYFLSMRSRSPSTIQNVN